MSAIISPLPWQKAPPRQGLTERNCCLNVEVVCTVGFADAIVYEKMLVCSLTGMRVAFASAIIWKIKKVVSFHRANLFNLYPAEPCKEEFENPAWQGGVLSIPFTASNVRNRGETSQSLTAREACNRGRKFIRTPISNCGSQLPQYHALSRQ